MKAILRIAAYVVSLGVYLLTLLSAFGGKVSPLFFALPSILVLVFPYIAAVTLIIGILWLLARRWLFAGLAGATIFLCWSSFHTALFPLGHASSSQPGDPTFTLISYNVLNGSDIRNDSIAPCTRATEYLLRSDADIICFQEYFQPDSALVEAYPYRYLSPAFSDLGILSKYPVKAKEFNFSYDYEYRGFINLYELDIDSRPVHILNVHLASYWLNDNERAVITRMRSLDSVKSSISEMKSSIIGKLQQSFRIRAFNALELRHYIDSIPGPLIVCGDFNDVPGSWAYRTVCGDDLADAFNATNLISLPTYNRHAFYFRIDQVLYRKKCGLVPLKVKRGNIDSSDHYPLEARFALTGSQ